MSTNALDREWNLVLGDAAMGLVPPHMAVVAHAEPVAVGEVWPTAPAGSSVANHTTSLRALGVEYAGARGRGGQWRCPNLGHADEHPSYDVFVGDNGKVVGTCTPCREAMGQDAYFAALTAIGVVFDGESCHSEEVDWGPAAQSRSGRSGGPKGKTDYAVVANYRYNFFDGTPNFKVRRSEDRNGIGRKTFSPQRWDADRAEYKGGVGALDRVLRTPYKVELFATEWAGERVFIVEGEKAADVLIAAGYRATTFHGGTAGKRMDGWTDLLKSLAGVDIWLDLDDAGATWGLAIRDEVKAAGIDYTVGANPEGGASWIAKGDAVEALEAGEFYVQRTKLAEIDRIRALNPAPTVAGKERGYMARAGARVVNDSCADDEAFWNARPMLTNLRDFARSRHVAPWAMFGCVLARASAAIPPNMVLPPLVGGVGSLNTYVALCGNSGGGKSAAMAAARDFLHIEGGLDFLSSAPGSGEGLIAAYIVWRKFQGGGGRFVQNNLSVLFVADEVQALGALGARTNSTLLPFLKSAWLGGDLATQNADPTRNRRLDAHRYRLALVAGVQPSHAGVILDDIGGGFPQRWLWMPTFDPSAGEPGVEPKPFLWNPLTTKPTEDADGNLTVSSQPAMGVAPVIEQAVYAARAAQNVPIGQRPIRDTLDGHAVFTREKVAALLALLDGGRREVTEADWDLACIVGAKSDETRALVMKAQAAEASKEADRRAARAGKSSAIAGDAADEARTLTAMTRLRSLLRDHDAWFPRGKLKNGLTTNQRPYFEDAIDRLVRSGEVVIETVSRTGRTEVTCYRLA